VILSRDRLAGDAEPISAASESGASRSRWLRERFSAEELQAMIDLYRSGAPARVVAEQYGVGVRSIKRLLHSRGVRRETPCNRRSILPGDGRVLRAGR